MRTVIVYFQVNRDTFVEVRAPSLSPRTGSRIAVATAPGGVNIELLEFGPTSLHRKAIESWKVESRK